MQNPDIATIAEVLAWQALHRPDKRVFLFLDRGERETESFTFAQLDRRAHAIGEALQQHELRGSRVILAYPSGLEFVAALFGCFYAGAVAVPAPVVGYRNSSARIRAIVEDAGAAAVLSLRSLLRGEVEGPDAIPALRIPGVIFIATDEILDGACQPSQVRPEDLALLQYTSGSTGTPRGVMINHSNLMHNQQVLSQALNSRAEETGVSWLPFFHDMGLMGSILHPVYSGVFCVLMAPISFMQKPIRWLNVIHRYRASMSMAPCFAYDLCARQYVPERNANLDLSCWRVAVCGGETIRPRLLERFTEAFRPAGFDPGALLAGYGLAESTLLATSSPPGTRLITQALLASDGETGSERQKSSRQFVCCGHPSEGQRVAIVDPETSRRLPLGEPGEIWLQGPSVAQGYWNRAEETSDIFQARLAGEAGSGFWLRTGDLGFLSPDGLVVTGRRKETLVIRGANYDPLDIETAACDCHPLLASAAAGAFSIDHEGGEGIVLAVEVERSALSSADVDLLVDTVVSAVNRRFGLTIHDLAFLHRGKLPRTTSGKIQRHVCRELYMAGSLGAVPAIDHSALGRCRPQARVPA